MKVAHKYIFAIVATLAICLAIGYAVQYFFGENIYRWLILGAIAPIAFTRFGKKEKQG